MSVSGLDQDRALIVRVQSGDREAFGELVSRYMRRANFSALGLVGAHEDALDLSQEAFARAFRARKTIDLFDLLHDGVGIGDSGLWERRDGGVRRIRSDLTEPN